MEINGYELASIAFMASSGPLWASDGPGGAPVLVALRSAPDGERSVGRWRAWAGIDDDHVARLLDVARHPDGRWAVVMERVAGETLEALMARGEPHGPARRRRIVEDVRSGLAALHAAGLVHGDVAPANVVVDAGRAVLVDLVDTPDEVEGTPGWSLGHRGPAGDLDALAVLAAALDVPTGDAGGRAPGTPGAGAGPPGAVPAGGSEPPAGAAVAEVLRRVAGSEETRRRDAPARHRGTVRRLRRGLAVAGACAALVAGVGLGVAGARGTLAGSGPDVGGAACPGTTEARALVADLVGRRDRAVEARDTDALASVVAGAAQDADRRLIASLEAAEVRVVGLGTEVTGVEGIECADGRTTLSATLRQGPHERCVADGSCRTVPAQGSHVVRLVLEGEPLRVVGTGPG